MSDGRTSRPVSDLAKLAQSESVTPGAVEVAGAVKGLEGLAVLAVLVGAPEVRGDEQPATTSAVMPTAPRRSRSRRLSPGRSVPVSASTPSRPATFSALGTALSIRCPQPAPGCPSRQAHLLSGHPLDCAPHAGHATAFLESGRSGPGPGDRPRRQLEELAGRPADERSGG